VALYLPDGDGLYEVSVEYEDGGPARLVVDL
jgi:hypothetical protein